MAQLLLNKKINTDGTKDIIGVYDDAHIFSETEQTKFDIVSFMGDANQIKKENSVKQKMIYRSTTTDWTEKEPELKMIYFDPDENYIEITNFPKYDLSYHEGTKKISNNIVKENKNPITVQKAVKAVGKHSL